MTVLVLSGLALSVWVLFPWLGAGPMVSTSDASASTAPSTSPLASGDAARQASSGTPEVERGSTASAANAEVVVHIAGAVRRPGLVRIPGSARVADAIAAAGGAAGNAALDQVNLAALVRDGEYVRIPARGEEGIRAGPGAAAQNPAGSSGGADSPSGTPGTALININTANAAELETLPRIGPALAGRIVAWREQHGPFASVEELQNVAGIGEKLLAGIRPLVVV